jgi:hypothetical protein
VVRLGGGGTLLDDCYNSNPVAVEAAVAALSLAAPGRRVAVLGDMRELGPTGPELHRRVGRAVAGKLDVLVAVGELAPGFLEGARQAGREEAALFSFPDAAAAAAGVTASDADVDALEARLEAQAREASQGQLGLKESLGTSVTLQDLRSALRLQALHEGIVRQEQGLPAGAPVDPALLKSWGGVQLESVVEAVIARFGREEG